MTQRSRITLAAASAATAALVLSACSGSSNTAHVSGSMSGMSSMSMGSQAATASGSLTAAGPHNTADISFASDMIPHHAQAVQMADMALKTARNAQVKTLATAIKTAQDPEIKQMAGWLTGWKKPVPATMGGMSMGHGIGMMSAADMTRLGKSTGAAFDRLWVQMMITHHQGAITMAQTELTNGQNAAAEALARSIVTSQSAQITQLKTLLTALPTS
jgi:uncharacterized protein (DUF305 family)